MNEAIYLSDEEYLSLLHKYDISKGKREMRQPVCLKYHVNERVLVARQRNEIEVLREKVKVLQKEVILQRETIQQQRGIIENTNRVQHLNKSLEDQLEKKMFENTTLQRRLYDLFNPGKNIKGFEDIISGYDRLATEKENLEKRVMESDIQIIKLKKQVKKYQTICKDTFGGKSSLVKKIPPRSRSRSPGKHLQQISPYSSRASSPRTLSVYGGDTSAVYDTPRNNNISSIPMKTPYLLELAKKRYQISKTPRKKNNQEPVYPRYTLHVNKYVRRSSNKKKSNHLLRIQSPIHVSKRRKSMSLAGRRRMNSGGLMVLSRGK